MRAVIFLLVGLVAGAAGGLLFKDSFPPPPGTLEARVEDLERTLARTQNQLAEAEARAPRPGPTTRQKLAVGARDIMEDLKAGHTVDMNDLFLAAKPALQDLSPIFDRLRRKDLRKMHQRMVEEMARRYHLTSAQQDSLRTWQQKKSEEEALRFRAAMDGSKSLEDMIKATKTNRTPDGMDAFMESTLTGNDLTDYQRDRLTQRAEQVQSQAEQKVNRLHSAVELDSAQQDQVFSIMARSSPDFDPSMKFEGLSDDSAQLSAGQSRDEAIMAVLRPDQRQKYEDQRIQRRAEAQKELNEVGLTLPPDWNMFDMD